MPFYAARDSPPLPLKPDGDHCWTSFVLGGETGMEGQVTSQHTNCCALYDDFGEARGDGEGTMLVVSTACLPHPPHVTLGFDPRALHLLRAGIFTRTFPTHRVIPAQAGIHIRGFAATIQRRNDTLLHPTHRASPSGLTRGLFTCCASSSPLIRRDAPPSPARGEGVPTEDFERSPSPLVGEGARRADEGVCREPQQTYPHPKFLPHNPAHHPAWAACRRTVAG